MLLVFDWSINSTDLAEGFGFAVESKFMNLFLFLMVYRPISFLLDILQVFITRTMEFLADRYSVDQDHGPHLHRAIIKMHLHTSANLDPDEFYAWMKFDRPTIAERLEDVEDRMEQYATIENQGQKPGD